LLLGRTRVRVDLFLEPLRVVAGDSVAGSVTVTNLASARMLPSMLDLPVGDRVHRYGLPALAPDASHEETFTIRTEARGVIPVGPAITRRGDPLGIFSRDLSWTDVPEILVRPEMVPLESLGAGLLRDLEGVSTDAVSQSDLAFHALREYQPGTLLHEIYTSWRWPIVTDRIAHNPRNQLEYAKIWRLTQARASKPVKFGTVSAQVMASEPSCLTRVTILPCEK